MAEYPQPEVGLVVSYSFLWSDEAARGQIEGRKDRPCAIVMSVTSINAAAIDVAVIPITHTPPLDSRFGFEIPPRVKSHLGLDEARQWIVLNELNVFSWPGFDLRGIRGPASSITYGFLPPKLFEQILDRFAQLDAAGEVSTTSRDE